MKLGRKRKKCFRPNFRFRTSSRQARTPKKNPTAARKASKAKSGRSGFVFRFRTVLGSLSWVLLIRRRLLLAWCCFDPRSSRCPEVALGIPKLTSGHLDCADKTLNSYGVQRSLDSLWLPTALRGWFPMVDYACGGVVSFRRP